MSGVSGDFSKLMELQKKFAQLAKPATRADLAKQLAEEYRNFMLDCFDQGRSPYGQAWGPPRVRNSVGGASQKPLMDTGRLRNSAAKAIGVNADGWRVVVPVIYASVHQYGAMIVPKNGKALRFRGTAFVQSAKTGKTRRKAGGWVFAKKVTIPARPFAPLSGMPAELKTRMDEAAEEFISQVLGED